MHTRAFKSVFMGDICIVFTTLSASRLLAAHTHRHTHAHEHISILDYTQCAFPD